MMKNLSLIHHQGVVPLFCVVEAPLQMMRTMILSALELFAFFVDDSRDDCSADVLGVVHQPLYNAQQLPMDCETSWHGFLNADSWPAVPCVGS